MKRISKQEARDKYGVIVTGGNSLYDYYLTDDGKVIDSVKRLSKSTKKTARRKYGIL